MKRVVISGVLLLGICALVIGSYFYITNSTSELIGKAEMVQKSFENGDIEETKLLAEKTEDLWKRFSSNRLLWAENEYIMEIGMLVARVSTMAKTGSEDLPVECSALLSILNDFYNNQIPNYKNIF